jgi:hypothetical protein
MSGPMVERRPGRLEDVRRSDVRFALSEPVLRIASVGGEDRWSRAFRGAGLAVVDLASCDPLDPPDLVAAPASAAAAAAASGAGALVLDGRTSRAALEAAGYSVRRVVAIPSAESPEVLVPAEDGAVLRYVLRNWTVPRQRWKVGRNLALGRIVPLGVAAPGVPVLTVAERARGTPFLARAAADLGVPAGVRWFIAVSQGDALSRGVLHLFRPGDDEPSWVLKFARVPGYAYPVERDRRGLDLARRAGGTVAAHAPRFLGRLEVGGLHATLETAAVGQRLPSFLASTAKRSSKLDAMAAVAGWTIDVMRETAAPADALAAERARLVQEVGPQWGLDRAVLQRAEGVPAVLAHNDLGTWNIVSGRAGFVALDWESAVEHGFPLWDLAYFLADASYQLDLGRLGLGRVEHFGRLFRGELARSGFVFERIRAAVRALAIPDDAVAPIITLGWLSHGLSRVGRDIRLELHAPGMGASGDEFSRMARLWLDDPALGPDWSLWR